jgi:hypothetical protein
VLRDFRDALPVLFHGQELPEADVEAETLELPRGSVVTESCERLTLNSSFAKALLIEINQNANR